MLLKACYVVNVCFFKTIKFCKAREMVQRGEQLIHKTDNPSLVPRTHKDRRELTP